MSSQAITIEFTIPTEQTSSNSCNSSANKVDRKVFVTSKVEPWDANYVSEEAAKSNTAIGYSGRHDNGPLPTMKSSGPTAILVANILEAKEVCDNFLTQCINEKYGYTGETEKANTEGLSNSKSTTPANKKMKVENNEEESMEL